MICMFNRLMTSGLQNCPLSGLIWVVTSTEELGVYKIKLWAFVRALWTRQGVMWTCYWLSKALPSVQRRKMESSEWDSNRLFWTVHFTPRTQATLVQRNLSFRRGSGHPSGWIDGIEQVRVLTAVSRNSCLNF